MAGPRILLVIGGGIAAYKSCELVRLIRKQGGAVTCVLTEGGAKFVTPMALAALSENPVHTTLWDLRNEVEMGHIQLSREADLIVVCPATANMLAKMAAGIADDLASTLLLATDKPVMVAPAMNVKMWQHDATQMNVARLRDASVHVVDPDEGAMACGEFGPGRLREPEEIWNAIAELLGAEQVELRDQAELAPAPPPKHVPAPQVEALEPEPEEESRGILGGLFASIIPRTTRKRSLEEIEAQWDAPVEESGADVDRGGDAAEEMPEPLAGAGPVLATKGKAKSAPPTDADAINHTVATGTGSQKPEPIADDGPLVTEDDFENDLLDGQPDFDETPEHRPLYGKHVLVTAGPTHEPIDPVRYIANRSSGKQGFAIAAAAANAGARVTLVAGPVHLKTPPGVDRVDVESAVEMADAVRKALPADAAVMVAAVADWRTRDVAGQKMKKRGSAPPALILEENPDILTNLSASEKRPRLVVGFAAETNDVLDNAKSKRKRKGADWIVANDVSGNVMGGDRNTVHIVSSKGAEALPEMPKDDVARALVERIAEALENMDDTDE
ncbi:bifunctional phosphopantothenoylcysteine decarboxylase/phosphopantothenate synthase [Erythrobacter sp. SDW2]|uniref:bifunctional phosphopantothenoylcysteine decarboxylase/phosphopantothenate synthase n=1 Tax=Erythrobacter sp. SDW2 TaxID=2907154 RepID=UPI001F43A584|nr:bifunctional phosphopantothenoylcysteine decarboxylase/phosphopantothenate synthase [Erythrobacter sp. SDW2]UIP06810.1 bifunctional phosphopantothenoylcysteine decarboxylase/phosphopantothenate synthase [Erythrobacter sp. SDW2]